MLVKTLVTEQMKVLTERQMEVLLGKSVNFHVGERTAPSLDEMMIGQCPVLQGLEVVGL